MARTGASESGMVTAETAVVLPVLVLLLVAGMQLVAVAAGQIRCIDAARVGARSAARGEALDQVRAAASDAAPAGAVVEIDLARPLITVVVRAPVRGAAALGPLAVVTEVSAHASALREAATDGTTP